MKENGTSLKIVLTEAICSFYHLRSELEGDVYGQEGGPHQCFAFVMVRIFWAFVSYVIYGAWYEILDKGLCIP